MSKIRVFHISSYYKLFLNFVEGHNYDKINFYDSIDYISSFRVAQNDIWKYYLEESNKFIVFQSIYNSKILANKWKEYRGVNKDFNEIELLKDQIDFFKPDLILDFSGGFFTKNKEQILRSNKPVISWDGYTLSNPYHFQSSDFILTCVPSIQNKYIQIGKKSQILPFGFDERLITEVDNSDKDYFCSFVGSIGFDHKNRLELLNKINDNFENFDYWIGNIKKNYNIFSKQFPLYALKLGFFNALKLSKLNKFNKGNVFGLEMYKILKKSLVTLNDHGDSVGDYAGNMRLFESSGLGVCLLTDYKSNLNSIFEIGKEVLAYKSSKDAVDILSEIKRNNSLAIQIAENCKKKTIAEYSYRKRAEELAEIILGLI